MEDKAAVIEPFPKNKAAAWDSENDDGYDFFNITINVLIVKQ